MKFVHKKSLGQNFLNNPHVPKVMVDAAHVQEGDLVLEVGPGTGALTRELLNQRARVIAIEADIRAIETLEDLFQEEIKTGSLTLIHADIKKLSLDSLDFKPHSYKVVANIPYYLSGFLFRFFLDTLIQPSVLVFLVQKEVAARIARDTKESLLSLSVKVFGDPQYVKTVKRGNFTPQPRVDSAIISVFDIGRHRLGEVSSDFFFSLIHEGFKAKRKQLLGNLSRNFDKTLLINTFSTLNLPLDVRAEDVPLETWLTLSKSLSSLK